MHAGGSVGFVVTAAIAVAAHSEEARLGYAGFTLSTSLADVQARFPDSKVSNSYVEIADSGSPDRVGYISIGPGLVIIGFRGSPATAVRPPRCMSVFDRIYATHGGPDMIQNSYEGDTKIHRRVWIRDMERLALRCFDRDGERYAERVEIYGYQDGAI